jgi:hypothetical protein
MPADATSGLLAERATDRRRVRWLIAAATTVVVLLFVLDVFSDPVRDWAAEHTIVTALGTGVVAIVVTGFVIDQRERLRERERTLRPALEATAALASAAPDAALTVATAYEEARIQYDLDLLEAEGGVGTERPSPVPALIDATREARDKLGATVDRWQRVARSEDIASVLPLCRDAEKEMELILLQLQTLSDAPRTLSESDWSRIAAGIGLLIQDGLKAAQIGQQAEADYILVETAGDDDPASQAIGAVLRAQAEVRAATKRELERLVESWKELAPDALWEVIRAAPDDANKPTA